MHMADALLSPAVGGVMWLVSGSLLAYSAKNVREEADDRKIPLMGVLGAFIFSAQMLNFSIPGTGSSGHFAGALLLAILLGPHAAFLVLASVLTVQAFFFADGGLLALGCNIFNMGFFACFVVSPLLRKFLERIKVGSWGRSFWTILGGVVVLELGAFAVVLETVGSGLSALPVKNFALAMLPIHLAIGLVEGWVTSGVVQFVETARPELLRLAQPELAQTQNLKKVLFGFGGAAVLLGGLFSWFASTHPDGLEWALAKTSGQAELNRTEPLHRHLASVQEGFAWMPDYSFKNTNLVQKKQNVAGEEPATSLGESKEEAWSHIQAETSLAGILGGVITLGLVALMGYGLRRRREWA